MLTKILVDTNILIDYSKGRDTVLDRLLSDKTVELYLNPVILAEYLADNSLKNVQKYNQAIDFLGRFKMLNITKNVGILTGEIMRLRPDAKWKDAMIAASCLVENCQLATRNQKHFKNVKNLKLI